MKTIGELKKKIRQFTDTEEESFFKDDELCCFVNMAIQRASKIISCLNKDYFTSCTEMDVAAEDDTICLPEDIMGNKIKKVFWLDGKTCCRLKRLDYDCYEDCASCGTTPEGFQFFNKSGEGPKLHLVPACHKAGKVRIIYERTPDGIDENTDDSTELEMEEFCDFVFYFVLKMFYVKEKNPLLNWAVQEMNLAQEMMEKCMCPQFGDDEDCELESDPEWECYVNEW